MSEVTISMDCPPFLKQFYVFHSGGSHPVKLRKGSPEAALLKVMAQKPPICAVPDLPAPEKLTVFLPYSKAKDPRIYSHVPQKAKEAFIDYVRSHFDRRLWSDVVQIRNFPKRLNNLIEAWMEANGITVDDRNYQSVIKRFRRMQALDRDARRKKSSRLSDLSKSISDFSESSELSDNSDSEDFTV